MTRASVKAAQSLFKECGTILSRHEIKKYGRQVANAINASYSYAAGSALKKGFGETMANYNKWRRAIGKIFL